MDKFTQLTLSMVVTTAFVAVPSIMTPAHAKSKHPHAKKSVFKSSKKQRHISHRPVSSGGCQTLSTDTLATKAGPYQQTIQTASKKYGVSSNLIKSVITIESCFKPNAKGSSGEKGLMQLMPGTARRFNIKNGYNAAQNIHGGTKYLSFLLDRYNGNTHRAVAAYNAGEGNISKAGKIPNAYYVGKVMHAYSKFSKGKTEPVFIASKAYQPEILSVGANFAAQSKAQRIAKADTKTATKHKTIWPWKTLDLGNKTSKSYTVKSGDTLYEVVRQTGIPLKTLVKLNRIKSPYAVEKGQVLRLA